jgi:PII-like signaling protein
MQTPTSARLLRLFVGESDRYHHTPFYEAVVLRAREQHLAGATVLRGPMGFGQSSRLHTAKLLRLSEDLSFVVEIVDTADKIEAFLPLVEGMIEESNASVLVTWEEVKVLHYGQRR